MLSSWSDLHIPWTPWSTSWDLGPVSNLLPPKNQKMGHFKGGFKQKSKQAYSTFAVPNLFLVLRVEWKLHTRSVPSVRERNDVRFSVLAKTDPVATSRLDGRLSTPRILFLKIPFFKPSDRIPWDAQFRILFFFVFSTKLGG